MTDSDYENIVAEYAAKRRGLQLSQAPPPPAVDRREIAACARMVQDCARAGRAEAVARECDEAGVQSYWRGMLYACRAMRAGLMHDASTDMLRSICETQRMMCRWAGAAAIGRRASDPREAADVVAFWEAVEAAYWDPDEEEAAIAARLHPGELADAREAQRVLHKYPRDAQALARFRNCRAVLEERARRLYDF
jgi:hypothetical protein